jgi:hypothetical protein
VGVRLLILMAVLALVRSCSGGEAEVAPPPEAACHGRGSPVQEQLLVRTLARHGFELHREDDCSGAVDEPVAMFTNIPASIFDTPEADVIFASDSQLWCDLYGDRRFDDEVRRTRLEEDEEVLVTVLNVECTMYDVNAWHVERLALAMKRLALGVP